MRREKGLEISRVDEGEGNNAVREKRNRRRGEEDELDEKVGRREWAKERVIVGSEWLVEVIR